MATEYVPKLLLSLNFLNEGQPKHNSDKYPVLKTKHKSAEDWWNSLNYGSKFKLCGRIVYDNKITVGEFAMHICMMSARYKWDCSSTKFNKLKKSQQKILKTIYRERNENYSIIDLRGALRLR